MPLQLPRIRLQNNDDRFNGLRVARPSGVGDADLWLQADFLGSSTRFYEMHLHGQVEAFQVNRNGFFVRITAAPFAGCGFWRWVLAGCALSRSKTAIQPPFTGH